MSTKSNIRKVRLAIAPALLGAALGLSACEGIEIGPVAKCYTFQTDCIDDPEPPVRDATASAPHWEMTGNRVHWTDSQQ